jgi:hypothetical protein
MAQKQTPRIAIPKNAEATPTGLPKPRVAKKAENPAITAAESAVQAYEAERTVLDEMTSDWEQNFPEASVARQEIMQQQDKVASAISAAKFQVAQAKQSIGAFLASRCFSKPGYDEKELTKILSQLKDRAKIFDDMMNSGIIEHVSLNKEASIAWMAQRPNLSQVFQQAFKDSAELTCKVTVPKL